MSSSPAKSLTIQSVERALDILEALAASPDSLPLSEIGARAKLNASTCHHLLSTLRERDYVQQDPKTRAYRLGNGVFALSDGRARQTNLLNDAMPALKILNERTSEAVHVAVLASNGLATLAKFESRHAVKADAGLVGKSEAAHATATGKAMLAFLDEPALIRFLDKQGLKAFTERTIRDPDALLKDLEEVRRSGLAEDREEFQLGVWCVGAPIRDRSGTVAASVSCSIPVFRATSETLDRIRAEVREAARAISERLGYDDPAHQDASKGDRRS